MLPGDRLVCAFVEPQKAGARFKTWMLHVTIVPWFRLEDSSERIAIGLQKALTAIQPFEAKTVGETVMGPRKRRAHLLESAAFPEIEQQVRNYLHKKRAWLVDETTKKPRTFRPHVTFQGDEHLASDDRVRCSNVYLVEQRGDYKEIMGMVELKP